MSSLTASTIPEPFTDHVPLPAPLGGHTPLTEAITISFQSITVPTTEYLTGTDCLSEGLLVLVSFT